MSDIQTLIDRLDIVVPKNPKSDWSKRQRQIVDEAISALKEYDAILKENELGEHFVE